MTPTVTSRTVDGTTLDITYSEPLDPGSTPAGGDFAVSVNGGGDAVDAVAFAGGNTVVRLTLHNATHFLDTVTVAYSGTAIQDPAGNGAATYSAQTVTNNTADAAPSTVTLSSPNNAGFVNSTTPSLTATFSDPDPNDTGTINFELCTASDCSASGDPFSTFSSSAGIVNGATGSASVPGAAGLVSGSTYYWRAKATDSNGSQSASYSSIRSFTVDTAAPTNAYSLVNVTTVGGFPVAFYPGSGTTIYYNGSAGSGAKSFTLEATVTDPISGGASVTTQNFNGGLSNLTHTDGTTTTPGSGVFDTNPFTFTAPTSHDAAVDVFTSDAAGNPSATDSFLIHNDTVAPTAAVTFPSASVYNTAGWTGTLTGTAADADAGVGTVEIAIHDNTANEDYDGSAFGSGGAQFLTATGTGSWSYPLAAAKLTDGHNYTVTVETIDQVGNTDPSAASTSFTYDTTPPTVSSVSASNANGAYNAGSTIHVQVNFSEPVNVTGSPKLALNTTPGESATYASGSGTSTLVFDYIVQPGDNVATLDYTATNALTLNGGTIGDPAGNAATLTLASPGGAGSLSASKSIAIDTVHPTADSVSASNADGSYKAGQTIHVQVDFSEPVDVTGSPQLALNTSPAESATYASGSGTSTLTFDYTVQAGDNVATLDYTATNALTLNGGTIDDPAGNSAILTLTPPGSAGSLSANKSLTIDTIAPTVSDVTASNANGSYKAGQTIHVQVDFSEPVNVTGSPQLALNTTPAESATYVSGGGTSTLTFDYTVQAGDNAATLDYTATNALTLNGGTIADPAANNATLTLASPGAANSLSANKSLTIDTTAPTVSSVTASNPNGAYKAGQTIHVQVNFSEPVNVTGSPELALNTTPAESATYASGSGTSTLTFDYTVQAGDNAATLDYTATNALTLNGGTITDPAANNATLTLASPGGAGSLSANKSLTIDTTAPTVSNVTASNPNGAYNAGQTIHVQINFNEPVNVTGSPKLALNTTPAQSATYASGSGTSTLTFDYTVQAGDNAAALDYTATNALTLNGGTITDPAGNNATLTLYNPGAAGSLSANNNLTIDTTAPTVSSVTASNPNGAYNAGQTIHVQVNFNEPVNVTGSPKLALNTSPAESATYASGSGTSTLTFDYTVQAGDNAATLDYTATNALTLNGGTITDPAANNATLTLASPGAAGSLSRQQEPHHRHHRPDGQLGLGLQPQRRLQGRPDHPRPDQLQRTRQRHRQPQARPQHHPRPVRHLRLRLGHLHPHLRLHHPGRRQRRAPSTTPPPTPSPSTAAPSPTPPPTTPPSPSPPPAPPTASRANKNIIIDTTAPTVSSRDGLQPQRRLQGRPDHPRPGQLQRARQRHRQPAARAQHHPGPVGHLRLRLGHLDPHLRLHRPGRRQRRHPRLHRHQRPHPQRRHDRRPRRQQRDPDARQPRRRRLALRQQEHHDRHDRADGQQRDGLERERRLQRRPDHPRPGRLLRAGQRHGDTAAAARDRRHRPDRQLRLRLAVPPPSSSTTPSRPATPAPTSTTTAPAPSASTAARSRIRPGTTPP